jgi:hypothetical protein
MHCTKLDAMHLLLYNNRKLLAARDQPEEIGMHHRISGAPVKQK